MTGHVKDFAGGTNYPAYKPYHHSTDSTLSNVWKRTLNAVYYTLDDILRHYYYFPIVEKQAEKFTGRKTRKFGDIEKDVSIVLVNTHSSFDIGVPLPANVIEIGGMHVAKSKPLSQVELYTIVCIYISI